MAKQQTHSAVTREQWGAIYRAQKADDFRAICEHLKAAKEMIVRSDLDENEILSVFSNAGIPVWPKIIPDILGARHIERFINEQVGPAIGG